MSTGNNNPEKLCEDCTTELVMVAKFREKCNMSSVALEQLKRQINKDVSIYEDSRFQETINSSEHSSNANGEAFYENVEYAEDNVEYVIYDTSSELIEDIEITEKSQDNDIDIMDDDNSCNITNVSQIDHQ